MYQEVILDHYKHPHHRGLREPFGAEVTHVNPTCGDEVTLRVALSDDGETVSDISYDGQGCSISQAATSVLTYQVIGQLGSILDNARDAETGQRGFLLTNDPRFLEPYRQARARIRTDLATLREMFDE